jgi:hypothetical protein
MRMFKGRIYSAGFVIDLQNPQQAVTQAACAINNCRWFLCCTSITPGSTTG